MGYWNMAPSGASLQVKDNGMIWGDAPADILDEAIDKIVAIFRRDFHRKPTKDELRSGLEFALGAYRGGDE